MKQKSYKKDHASNISAKFGCSLSCGLWDKNWCMIWKQMMNAKWW